LTHLDELYEPHAVETDRGKRQAALAQLQQPLHERV
jgi:hypothetical protein